jgi:cation transport regulator ChaB
MVPYVDPRLDYNEEAAGLIDNCYNIRAKYNDYLARHPENGRVRSIGRGINAEFSAQVGEVIHRLRMIYHNWDPLSAMNEQILIQQCHNWNGRWMNVLRVIQEEEGHVLPDDSRMIMLKERFDEFEGALLRAQDMNPTYEELPNDVKEDLQTEFRSLYMKYMLWENAVVAYKSMLNRRAFDDLESAMNTDEADFRSDMGDIEDFIRKMEDLLYPPGESEPDEPIDPEDPDDPVDPIPIRPNRVRHIYGTVWNPPMGWYGE